MDIKPDFKPTRNQLDDLNKRLYSLVVHQPSLVSIYVMRKLWKEKIVDSPPPL